MKIPAQLRINPIGQVACKASDRITFRGVLALLATLATLSSVMGLTSCVGYTSAASSQPPSAGLLTPSATTVNFGSVATGGTTIQTVSVTNTGTATVNIAQASISGTGFAIVGGNPTASIPVGQSSSVQIQFAPQLAGTATGSLDDREQRLQFAAYSFADGHCDAGRSEYVAFIGEFWKRERRAKREPDSAAG